jgi:hypothetical protein
MFHRSKRLIALIFATTILFGCLTSGCGSKKEDTSTPYTNPAHKKTGSVVRIQFASR